MLTKIVGGENKKVKKTQINIENIAFKIFDTSLIDRIEVKYIFDEENQLVSINRIPIELDV
jgi:hypothetical protein